MLESMKVTKGDCLKEIVIVDDGSTDGSCDFLEGESFQSDHTINVIKGNSSGPAKARNIGARSTDGEVLIFCDAHLIINDPYWIEKLMICFVNDDVGAVCAGIESASDANAIGYGVTLDKILSFSWIPKPSAISPVPVGPGGCIAIRRDVFNIIGGFEENFPAWGHEDVEISIKMWLFGYQILVNPHVTVAHVFRTQHPYTLKYEDVDYNLLWMAICHFDQRRLLKVMEMVNRRNSLDVNLKRLLSSGVFDKSKDLRSRRKYDDSWYFKKFNIDF